MSKRDKASIKAAIDQARRSHKSVVYAASLVEKAILRRDRAAAKEALRLAYEAAIFASAAVAEADGHHSAEIAAVKADNIADDLTEAFEEAFD